MNDQILFRGFCPSLGVEIEGFPFITQKGEYQILVTKDGVGSITVGAWNIKKETLSRFTGLKDSKGRKIFEGDLIKMKLEDSVEPEGFYWWEAEVKFVHGCWVLCQVGFDYSNKSLEDFTWLYPEAKFFNETAFQVAGNIYQLNY